MDTPDFSNYLGADPDDPAATAARYDALLCQAVASGSEVELRSLYSRLEAVAAITGGFACAAANVLALPEEALIFPQDPVDLEAKRAKFARIEQIARDAMSRVLEFLESD